MVLIYLTSQIFSLLACLILPTPLHPEFHHGGSSLNGSRSWQRKKGGKKIDGRYVEFIFLADVDTSPIIQF
ncbi:hypothetical protein F5Y04DRAFT_204773 [Hypomontagnella monticulosa]|nr:hypothetical protein F5Y04DRAFT_204773 [Hypomontagnella monticulosa]